jgi:hypothetical protein
MMVVLPTRGRPVSKIVLPIHAPTVSISHNPHFEK